MVTQPRINGLDLLNINCLQFNIIIIKFTEQDRQKQVHVDFWLCLNLFRLTIFDFSSLCQKQHQAYTKLLMRTTSLSPSQLRHQNKTSQSVGSKSSSWLTVLPISLHHFVLSATEFSDSLTLRYHRPLLMAPANCDGCGNVFSLTHALDYRKGGLVIQCHNEIRDAIGDLASLVYMEVIWAPVADLSIRGVWHPQTVALFDIQH